MFFHHKKPTGNDNNYFTSQKGSANSLLLTACNRKDLPKSYLKDFTIVILKQYLQ